MELPRCLSPRAQPTGGLLSKRHVDSAEGVRRPEGARPSLIIPPGRRLLQHCSISPSSHSPQLWSSPLALQSSCSLAPVQQPWRSESARLWWPLSWSSTSRSTLSQLPSPARSLTRASTDSPSVCISWPRLSFLDMHEMFQASNDFYSSGNLLAWRIVWKVICMSENIGGAQRSFWQLVFWLLGRRALFFKLETSCFFPEVFSVYFCQSVEMWYSAVSHQTLCFSCWGEMFARELDCAVFNECDISEAFVLVTCTMCFQASNDSLDFRKFSMENLVRSWSECWTSSTTPRFLTPRRTCSVYWKLGRTLVFEALPLCFFGVLRMWCWAVSHQTLSSCWGEVFVRELDSEVLTNVTFVLSRFLSYFFMFLSVDRDNS